MIRRPPRSTLDRSSAASDVYKRQGPWERSAPPPARIQRVSCRLLAKRGVSCVSRSCQVEEALRRMPQWAQCSDEAPFALAAGSDAPDRGVRAGPMETAACKFVTSPFLSPSDNWALFTRDEASRMAALPDPNAPTQLSPTPTQRQMAVLFADVSGSTKPVSYTHLTLPTSDLV